VTTSAGYQSEASSPLSFTLNPAPTSTSAPTSAPTATPAPSTDGEVTLTIAPTATPTPIATPIPKALLPSLILMEMIELKEKRFFPLLKNGSIFGELPW